MKQSKILLFFDLGPLDLYKRPFNPMNRPWDPSRSIENEKSLNSDLSRASQRLSKACSCQNTENIMYLWVWSRAMGHGGHGPWGPWALGLGPWVFRLYFQPLASGCISGRWPPVVPVVFSSGTIFGFPVVLCFHVLDSEKKM